MTYADFQDLCAKNKTSVRQVVNQVGMTYEGIRKGLENDTLATRVVVHVCKILNISPNEFCYWQAPLEGDINYGNMQKGAKKQIMTIAPSEELRKTIDMLEQELKTKNEQIAKLIEKL